MENKSTNRVLSDEANNEQLRPTEVTGSPKFIPILFSTPMVQAILDGRKTQTRRSIKKQPIRQLQDVKMGYWSEEPENLKAPYIKCPYGQPGDILWVRETLEADFETDNRIVLSRYAADKSPVLYSTNDDYNGSVQHWESNKKAVPSIHMPKAACRIFLRVKSVRVERLGHISRGDAMAEGCPFPNMAKGLSPVDWFADLWNSINGPNAFESNPFVWVVEFRRVERPTGFL